MVARRSGYRADTTAESIALDSLLPPLVLLCIAAAAFGAQLHSPLLGTTGITAGFTILLVALTFGRRLVHARLLAVLPDSSHRFTVRLRLALAGETPISAHDAIPVLLLYFAWGITRTIAFVVLTRSVAGLDSSDSGFVAVAGAVGGLAGQLSFIAPMGIGVREGVAAGMLASRASVAGAATAVSATRVVQIVAEVPAMLITELFYLVYARSHQDVSQSRTDR